MPQHRDASYGGSRKMRFYAEHCGCWDKARQAVLRGLPLGLPFEQASFAAAAQSSPPHQVKAVGEAVAKFLAELSYPKARKRQASTVGKYRTLLTRLQAFCADRGLTSVAQISLEDLMDFRDSWPTAPRATGNNINRLRSFYKFCLRFKWVDENLAKKIDSPEGEDVQVEPWGPEQFDLVVRTAERFPLDRQQVATNEELVAFILVVRHTGLRISDAALLTQDRLLSDGTVRLRYGKEKEQKGRCQLGHYVAATRSVRTALSITAEAGQVFLLPRVKKSRDGYGPVATSDK
jgi:site-specific recombinase XerC